MDYYIGSILLSGYNFAPMNFAFCNGASMSISQNNALYSLLGTQFGGNGTTNFNLPNLCGKVPVGSGSDGSANYVVGQTFGDKTKVLSQNEMPAHSHTLHENQPGNTVVLGTPVVTVNASNVNADKLIPTSNYWANGWTGSANVKNYDDNKNVTMASDAVQVSVSASFNVGNLTVNPAGSGVAFSLAQPSLVLNYCICTAGIYPSRG